jgi:hypothetical protein
MSYAIGALFAAFLGGIALASGRKAFDSMEPVWFGLWIAFLAVIIGGALLSDWIDGRNRDP